MPSSPSCHKRVIQQADTSHSASCKNVTEQINSSTPLNTLCCYWLDA